MGGYSGNGKDDGPKKTKKLPDKPELREKYENEVGLLKEKVEKLKKEGRAARKLHVSYHSVRREIGFKYKDLTPPELRDKIYKMNKKDYGDPLE